MTLSNDLYPEISEADAIGEIALVYGDIRKTLRVPFVNLIWRRIASVPGALGPVWAFLRPIYTDSRIAHDAAKAMRTAMSVPVLDRIPEGLWRQAGLSATDRQEISALLLDFDQANVQNLITFSILLAFMKPDLLLDIQMPQPIHQGPVSLGNFGNLPPSLAKKVIRFNSIAATRDTELRQATLPIRLAQWPPVLDLFISALVPFDTVGEIEAARTRLWVAAQQNASSALLSLDQPCLMPEVKYSARQILDPFLETTLCRMIVIVSMLRFACDADIPVEH